MELDSLPFRDAVGVLAKRVNLEVPDTGGFQRRHEGAAGKAADHQQGGGPGVPQVAVRPGGAAGAGLPSEARAEPGTLTRFGLGFAPDRWDGLLTALAEQGWDKADLLDAGLAVSNKDGRIYDRFRNRVMFPIIDIRGT